jgi:hypothetical protein
MKPPVIRLTFAVVQHSGGWAVEHDGAYTDLSSDRNEVLASASRRARAANDAGALTQVVMQGERGYFASGR